MLKSITQLGTFVRVLYWELDTLLYEQSGHLKCLTLRFMHNIFIIITISSLKWNNCSFFDIIELAVLQYIWYKNFLKHKSWSSTKRLQHVSCLKCICIDYIKTMEAVWILCHQEGRKPAQVLLSCSAKCDYYGVWDA